MAKNYVGKVYAKMLDDDGHLVTCPAYVTLDGDFTTADLRQIIEQLDAADAAAKSPDATE